MTTKSVLSRKVQLAFGSAILTLLVVGAISYRSMVASSESDRWVWHTHDVIANLQDLLAAMLTVESSCRGYVLSGDESFNESYRAGIARLQQEQSTIRRLTADNASQQRRLAVLDSLAAQKLQLAEKVTRLRQTKGLDAALTAVQSGGGKQVMDDFQAVIREMQEEELRLLTLRDAEARQRLRETKTVLILGTVLGVLIAAAAGWSVQRDSSKRELAEEALQGSEDKYRRLVQGVQDYAILMLGPEGEIRSWNPGAERMTGCTFEEVVGQNFSRFYSPEDIKRGRPGEILRLAAAGGMHEEKGMRVRKNGARFLVLSTYTASRDETGKLLGFSVVSRDLSHGAESEAKYRGLLEAAPDAMVVVNQSGEIVLLNVQAEKQFGYHRDELVGQKVRNIIPEGFAERLIADGTRTAAEALAQQIGTGIELTGRRKNGSEFPIEIMLSPLESAEGILVTAAIRDISVRRDAEKHLARMEGRYRGLLEAAPDAMVVVNPHGDIVLLNVQSEKQFGIAAMNL
jgi:PAS domain S-box-containing protein